jgi:hypothetical protein
MKIKLDDSGRTRMDELYYAAHDVETGEEFLVLDSELRRQFGLREPDLNTYEWMMAAQFDGFKREGIYDPSEQRYQGYGSW